MISRRFFTSFPLIQAPWGTRSEAKPDHFGLQFWRSLDEKHDFNRYLDKIGILTSVVVDTDFLSSKEVMEILDDLELLERYLHATPCDRELLDKRNMLVHVILRTFHLIQMNHVSKICDAIDQVTDGGLIQDWIRILSPRSMQIRQSQEVVEMTNNLHERKRRVHSININDEDWRSRVHSIMMRLQTGSDTARNVAIADFSIWVPQLVENLNELPVIMTEFYPEIDHHIRSQRRHLFLIYHQSDDVFTADEFKRAEKETLYVFKRLYSDPSTAMIVCYISSFIQYRLVKKDLDTGTVSELDDYFDNAMIVLKKIVKKI